MRVISGEGEDLAKEQKIGKRFNDVGVLNL